VLGDEVVDAHDGHRAALGGLAVGIAVAEDRRAGGDPVDGDLQLAGLGAAGGQRVARAGAAGDDPAQVVLVLGQRLDQQQRDAGKRRVQLGRATGRRGA
jgi:hypothetical protein